MTCTDVGNLIEPWASGELAPPPEAVAHVGSCAACAARLALARQIDAALDALPTMPMVGPSAQFTANVLRQVRLAPAPGPRSWIEEGLGSLGPQALSMLAACLAIVAAGAWSLLSGDGALPPSVPASLAVPLGAADAVAGALTRATLAIPPLAYLAASGMLVMTLMLWQWAEEDLV